MRGLSVVAVLVAVSGLWAFVSANSAINANLSSPVALWAETAPTDVAVFSVPDTGYNSATDLLQTAGGINDFQNASYLVQN